MNPEQKTAQTTKNKPKLLPIGSQDFKSIIEDNCVYVDKTPLIYDLLTTSGKYFFLSRPRRFGKSLLVSALKYIFLGEKELFKGMFIETTDWEFQKYPVIELSFNVMPYDQIGLRQAIHNRLCDIAKQYEIELSVPENGEFFDKLINALHKKHNQRVVILIDEYDKPILENLENSKIEIARENRDILRSFYGAVKSNDHAIKFFFMTGVSRFSQTSIFSQLNNLKDITLAGAYAKICGFTDDELKAHGFEYYIEKAKEIYPDLWNTLQQKYNGFSWNGKDSLYNPFSYLQFLASGEMANYWTTSGTPKLLSDLLRDKNYDLTQIRKQTAYIVDLLSFDIEKVSILSLAFQTGYLTIKEKLNDNECVLDFPNQEVAETFNRHVMTTYTQFDQTLTASLLLKLRTALQENRFDDFMYCMESLFAGIPYQIIVNKEAYFHSIFYIICHLLSFEMDCEVSTSRGRIDATIKTKTHIYLMEFKIDDAPENAIKQIIDKGYGDKYKTDSRSLVLAGICFDTVNKEFVYKVKGGEGKEV